MNRSTIVSLVAGLAGLATLASCDAGTTDLSSPDSTVASSPQTTAAESSTTTADAPPAATTATVPATTAPTTTATPTSTASTTAPPDAPPVVAGVAECLPGGWRLTTVSGGGAVAAGVSFNGDVSGVAISFGTSDWTLVATDAVVGAELAALGDVELRFDGTATGDYEVVGDQVRLALEDADGEVSSSPPYGDEIDFSAVVASLAPGGGATASCSEAEANLATDTMSITLARDAAPTTTAPAPPAPGLDDLIITASGQHTCDGRSIMINGSVLAVQLEGNCGAVTVNGDTNVVEIERTDTINVTGSFNTVEWSAGITSSAPSVTDTGNFNTIAQR